MVRADLDSIGVHSAPELLSLMVMGPQEVATYLAAIPGGTLNTDDNAYLEYHTPFDVPQKFHKLLAGLLPYTALDLRDVSNISPEETDQVRQAWENQKLELLRESQIRPGKP